MKQKTIRNDSTIEAIQKLGHQTYNVNTQEELLAIEEEAYDKIFNYIFIQSHKFTEDNWYELYKILNNEIKGNKLKLKDIHRQINTNTVPENTKYPLILYAFFYQMNVSFKNLSIPDQRKTVFVDMDNVIVDFPSAFDHYSKIFLEKHPEKDEIKGIFSKMNPIDGAIEAMEYLYKHYDVYILSTAPWNNPSAWKDKVKWVQKYLPIVGYKRLILSHHKNLNQGDYLIDDRIKNGVHNFSGKHIHFGTAKFTNWEKVIEYFRNLEEN